MASYKRRIFDDLTTLLDKYPNAKASDVIWVLEAVADALWRALPPVKKNARIIERGKKYRVMYDGASK